MAAIVLLNSAQTARQQSGAFGIICLKAGYCTDVPRPVTMNTAAMKRGTGGRSSFNGVVATVFGSTGFTGRYVCNKLGKIGSQMILPYRAEFEEAKRLKLCGDLGQVLFKFYDVHDDKAIYDSVKHSNVVINLIGRDWETKNFKFDDVHVKIARKIARISREAGVEKFIHLSALNATSHPEPLVIKGGSKFLKSKFMGEAAVREEFPDAIIFRPADVYGQEDRFLRYYSHIWRRQFHSMPLWYKGEKTIKQPVFVSDLAQAIVNATRDPDAVGKTFQAVGPKRYTLAELVDWFHRVMRKDENWWGYYRYDLRYDPTFMMKVNISNMISPSFPIGDLHPERIEREYVTDLVHEGIPTLEDLGVTLTAMEDQVPWELRPFRAAQYYEAGLDDFAKPTPPKCIESKLSF